MYIEALIGAWKGTKWKLDLAITRE